MTTALKGIVVAVAAALGALFAVGFILAAMFEAQGFGGPRDEGPRTGYMIELAIGFVASVTIPVVLWRKLLPDSGPAWLAVAATAVVGVLAILGLTLHG